MSFLSGNMTTGALSNLTQRQQSLLDEILKQVEGQVGKGIEPYPGTTVPGSNTLLDQLFSQAGGYTGSPLYTGSASVLERALGASPDYGATRDFWTDAFLNPMMSQFKRDILPSIREQNIGQGTFRSGGRYRAETNAAGDLMTNLTGQLANLMYGERESTLNRAMEAVPQAQNLQGGAMNILTSGGGLLRGFEQEGLAEDYSKWAMSQPYNNPWLQLAPTALGVQAQSPYLYQGAPSTMGTIANAGIGAIASGGAMGLGQGLGSWLTQYLTGK